MLPVSMTNGNDAQKFDFDFPIFKTAHGEQYKQLIQDLVKPNPADRIPVATALQTLKSLNIIVSSNEFAELEALKFGKKDKVMQKFIEDKKQEIMKADTPEKRDAVLKEVKDMVTALNSNKGIVEVKQIADDFRHQAGIFSIGKNAKAKRIEEAVSHMTLEERCNFFKSEHRAEVLEALASRRSLINNGKVYRTTSGDIDEGKAARSFVQFKKKYDLELKDARAENKETAENKEVAENKETTSMKI